MAQNIERILGWVAFVALVLCLAALAVTYIPGGEAIRDRIIAAFPHAAETPNIDDAQAALDSGDSASANKLAKTVIAASSADATVDNHAGNIAQAAGDDATAEHDYQLGEAADARNGWNYVALGQLYARQNKLSLADAQLRAALAIVPDTQFLHYDLGVVELNEHLADAALADFNAELKRTPGYQPAVNGKIQALQALGRPAEARAVMLAFDKTLSGKGGAVANPSPTALPSASPGASASPTAPPTPTPAPSPIVAVSPTPLPIAQIVPPSPSPAALKPAPAPTRTTLALALKHPKRIVTPRPLPSPPPTPTPTSTPYVRMPQSIADLASDAKGYLFDVASDPGFGGELPFADPTESVTRMEAQISKGTVDQILSAGTAAMLSHHFALAASAFSAASSRAVADWRGPYLAGVNAQQRGDQAGSRAFFSQAAQRGGPSAVYVALAVADVAVGDDTTAYSDAQRAVQMEPMSGAALFTAGMVDILVANVPSADKDLSAAAAASGAPSRTAYFLQTIRAREESTP